MTEIEYNRLVELNLRELGFWNKIDLKNCWILMEEYHFKWWVEDGDFHFSATSLYDKLDIYEINNLRIELAFVATEVNRWFHQYWHSESENVDSYISQNSYGYFEIEAHDDKNMKITISDSYHRQ